MNIDGIILNFTYFVLDFPEVLCPMGWIGIKDRCYRYYTQQDPAVNFTGAEAICQESGGNLARANFYDCNFVSISTTVHHALLSKQDFH